MEKYPSWLNRAEYPFTSHYFQTDAGKLHYIDEGQGETLVFVHGTPVWSFLWRHLIKGLRSEYRCIAIDHLGFGLSDKPHDWAYTPEAHAINLEQLIQSLGLKDITLVVHDFGGPIGLSYAINHPHNVKRLVLMNTFLWSFHGNKDAERAHKIFSSGFGKFLYTNMNFSTKYLLPMVYANKLMLTKEIKAHYTKVWNTAAERIGTWRFAQEIMDSSWWYYTLYEQHPHLRDIPALILWGMRDMLITPDFLGRWKAVLPQAEIIEYPKVGHFIQEELGSELCDPIQKFIHQHR